MDLPGELCLGSRVFAPDELVIMAIINRTPDSFFDKGATWEDGSSLERALATVDAAVAEGAAIVDIGGVKAGPGDIVEEEEEVRRVVPLIEAVRSRHPDVVISVDTWRSAVAREAIAAGADLLNDAWGGHDPDLAGVAAELGTGLVCVHVNGATPRTRPHRVSYPPGAESVVDSVASWLEAEAARVLEAGVRPDGILIDPGHDFGKSTRHSLALTRRLDELVASGLPVLVALSNKDFVGETLDLPVGDRLEGTLAATAVSAWLGARVFRCHQVGPTRRVLDMVASIKGTRPPAVARRGLA